MIELRDTGLQGQLLRDGYFTIPLIDESKIVALRRIFEDNFRDHREAFYASSFHNDIALKKKLSAEVTELVSGELDSLFSNYKIIGASFLEKKAGENYALPIHQDWTVTDEQQFGSFSVWIALQDTVETNGALRVIPGSHAVENNFRAPSIPVAFANDRDKLEKHLVTLPMKAGEAFIFNQKLMHASWPNVSGQNRLAITIGVVPEDASLSMLYYDRKKEQISRYAMPDDMFLHYPEIINGPGIGKLEEQFHYTPGTLTEKQLVTQLKEKRMKKMKPLFAVAAHQEFFEANGYLIVPALDRKDCEELTSFLYSSGIKKVTDYGFYVGMDHEDKNLVGQMMEKVAAVALPKLEKYLAPFQLITASYVIKDPNPKGIVPPHQDWTFVENEEQHCSVTCWIPLQDTDMQNGCMGVIKGSNSYFNSVRPSPSPQAPSPLAKHLFGIFPNIHLLEMNAGDALFFDNRTVHASPPNTTDAPRLAVGLSFTQKEASLRHFFLKPGTKNKLLKYKIDESFFRRYDNASLSKLYDAGKAPEGFELMGEVPFEWEDWSKDQFAMRMKESGNTYNGELTRQMTLIFGNQMKDGVIAKIKRVLSFLKP